MAKRGDTVRIIIDLEPKKDGTVQIKFQGIFDADTYISAKEPLVPEPKPGAERRVLPVFFNTQMPSPIFDIGEACINCARAEKVVEAAKKVAAPPRHHMPSVKALIAVLKKYDGWTWSWKDDDPVACRPGGG